MNIRIVLAVVMTSMMLVGCASTGPSNQGQVERITPEELAKLMPAPVATVSLDELIVDSKQGKTSDEIIAKIKESDSRYALTPEQIVNLNKKGVDFKVLDYIQQSNELAKQNAIAEEINKREKAKVKAQKELRRERAFSRNRYYDPFWGPRFGFSYGRRHWHGSHFGWGLGYGRPYYW